MTIPVDIGRCSCGRDDLLDRGRCSWCREAAEVRRVVSFGEVVDALGLPLRLPSEERGSYANQVTGAWPNRPPTAEEMIAMGRELQSAYNAHRADVSMVPLWRAADWTTHVVDFRVFTPEVVMLCGARTTSCDLFRMVPGAQLPWPFCEECRLQDNLPATSVRAPPTCRHAECAHVAGMAESCRAACPNCLGGTVPIIAGACAGCGRTRTTPPRP